VTLALADDEVHLWWVLPDEIGDPRLLAAYEALLAPEERARRARYHFEHSRREYLLTRALVRGTLARYVDVAPAALGFTQNEHGRPEMARADLAWLRFNVSNTKGLLALAVTRGRDVGVDVEDTERRGDTVSVADRFFSPIEVEALRALPEDAQRERFFTYWTLKEAYIKARGMGLAIPLDHFSFLLDPEPGAPVAIRFDPQLPDDPASWQFARFDLTPRHHTAAAVRRGAESDLRFVVRRTVPLASP
jgi:4'-phosphopantetheinyl transferase